MPSGLDGACLSHEPSGNPAGKKAAVVWIDSNAAMLKQINRTIWEYAEPGMLVATKVLASTASPK